MPWSNKLDLKVRREKRQARKAFAAESRKRAADDDDAAADEDLAELAADTRLLKRLKKGKISQAEYDASLGGAGAVGSP